ncbi:hypothetical protein DFH07DRAFT_134632 [Mycena maculata]|uniref:Uncharacterized protein n=1 Tax=Mycena maculata TaxID=230809 RepID=A0AAD7I2F6_9AGAR|nr:hypothetical protein DFH07DRAFT_134632 [Mycena maculata]
MRFCSTSLAVLAALLLLPPKAAANTEITNFAASERADDALLRVRADAFGWPTMRPRETADWTLVPAPLGTLPQDICSPPSARHLNLTSSDAVAPCPHELWLTLDLDEAAHTRYTKFTLRLSWVASYPTDFYMDILDPAVAASLLALTPGQVETDAPHPEPEPQTRRKYARIRARDAGVRTPPSAFPFSFFPWFPFASVPSNLTAPEDAQVPFVLTLEPLLLSVLPASLLPFLLLAAVVLGAAGAALPWVQAFIGGLVDEARKEMKEKGE